MHQDLIRNFAIIAHIDHGKSTLADRLLELTGTVAKRDMQEQLLDSNPIERERGITIKLAPVRMLYQIQNSESRIQNKDNKERQILNSEFYILNLIDTPGHVDFSYEVSRSLAACEGALLVVDATQGVQAQTLAHLAQARSHNLTIIPIINKIDMPTARIAETIKALESLGFRSDEVLKISAKYGTNVKQVLEAIVERIPSPKGVPSGTLRALVFSSQYDPHKGVVVFVRVVDGEVSFGNTQTPRAASQQLHFMASGADVTPIEIGYFLPRMMPSGGLSTGEVGYIATGLKDIRVAKVGDTVTMCNALRDTRYAEDKNNTKFSSVPHPASRIPHPATPLAGYKEPKPMVFLGLFPVSADEFGGAREAMEKLRLSDSAFTFRPISSVALGNGFHCGFLGLLHAEIIQERMLREFGLTMIATAPSVEYLVKLKGKSSLPRRQAGKFKVDDKGYYSIQSASEFPDPSVVEEIREPVMQVAVYSPKRYVGAIMQLAQEKRGEYIDLKYFGLIDQARLPAPERSDSGQAEFTYLIPLSDMIIDFFDRLKSITEGYASLDYEFYDYRTAEIVKVDILLNHEKVDALSFLVVKDQAQRRAREIVEKLATVIPRAQFSIPVQGALGGTVIARADIKPFRKDVIQKLYGGDRTRKDKLLDKQKKGKARMKQIGKVEIPQTAFFDVLKR